MTKDFHQTTAAFVERFGGLSPEVLNRKPNAQSWSLAEIMAHLIQINGSYPPIIARLRAGAYKAPLLTRFFPFIPRMLGNFILQSVSPDRKRPIKTFPVWEPLQSQVDGDIVRLFEASQNDFEKFMESCQDLVEQGALIHSPANKNIVYSVGKAFEIVMAHAERHLNQALETYEQVRKN